MKTRTYKLYGASTTSANALASVIIQRDGYISAIHGSIVMDAVADAHYIYAELSFVNVSQVATNDTLGPIFELREYLDVAANGATVSGQNSGISGIAIPVKAGDRLYLNITSSACNGFESFFVYVAE